MTVSGVSTTVTTLTKYLCGHAYVFAMSDGDAAHPRSGTTNATFTVDGLGDATVSVPEEGRSLRATGGRFTDSFGPYQWHIYRIRM
ncbi:MAG TPA: hypothetical protein VKP64_12490 [Mycobacteriales bacterium]|nr:hypothetical protein [Mycobacteriales bacterium]